MKKMFVLLLSSAGYIYSSGPMNVKTQEERAKVQVGGLTSGAAAAALRQEQYRLKGNGTSPRNPLPSLAENPYSPDQPLRTSAQRSPVSPFYVVEEGDGTESAAAAPVVYNHTSHFNDNSPALGHYHRSLVKPPRKADEGNSGSLQPASEFVGGAASQSALSHALCPAEQQDRNPSQVHAKNENGNGQTPPEVGQGQLIVSKGSGVAYAPELHPVLIEPSQESLEQKKIAQAIENTKKEMKIERRIERLKEQYAVELNVPSETLKSGAKRAGMPIVEFTRQVFNKQYDEVLKVNSSLNFPLKLKTSDELWIEIKDQAKVKKGCCTIQ